MKDLLAGKASDCRRRTVHERIALSGPGGELKALADLFDSMLARLDAAFDGQRLHAANAAAHDPRTRW
jgi:hypothetical protein